MSLTERLVTLVLHDEITISANALCGVLIGAEAVFDRDRLAVDIFRRGKRVPAALTVAFDAEEVIARRALAPSAFQCALSDDNARIYARSLAFLKGGRHER